MQPICNLSSDIFCSHYFLSNFDSRQRLFGRQKRGKFMNTYVVRVYRSQDDEGRLLVGVVEEIGVEGKKAFNNLDELWTILNPEKGTPEKHEDKEGSRI